MDEVASKNELKQSLNDNSTEFPRIFCATVFASLLIIFLLFFHLFEMEKSKIRNTLEIQSLKIEKELTTLLKHTSAINNNINWHISKDPYNKNHIFNVLKYYNINNKSVLSWTLFSWVNSHYKLNVDSEYGVLKNPLELSGRDYLPITEQKPYELQLGRPVTGSTSGKWMIPGGNGIVDHEGKYLGAVVIGFEIDYLAKILSAEIEDERIEFGLFDDSFTAILYGNKKTHGPLDGNIENDEETKMLFEKFKSNQGEDLFQSCLLKRNKGFLIKKLNNVPYYIALKYNNMNSTFLPQSISSHFDEISIVILILIILLIFTYKKEKSQRQKIDFLRDVLRDSGILNNNSFTRPNSKK
ncbi:MAG: hypothetical protein FJ368_01130 [Pelagibacterales bacterium]|nr:hypothetical protein [Pelagibacterales bacterium]